MIALVAGATRGAGRGIAVALGEAGRTVYVTGRSTRAQRSEIDRPETIEETAELVTAAGRRGHPRPGRPPRPGAGRRRWSSASTPSRPPRHPGQRHLGLRAPLRVDDAKVWEHDLADGLRLLRLALDTHLITSHYALPLLLDARRPRGGDDRRDGRLQRRPLPGQPVLRPGQGRGDPHGLGSGAGAWRTRHRRRPHARLAALGGDARALRRHRGELARGDRVPHFCISESPRVCRPRRGRAGRRPGRRAAGTGSRSPAAGSPRSMASRTPTARGRTAGATSSRCSEAGLPAGDAGYR